MMRKILPVFVGLIGLAMIAPAASAAGAVLLEGVCKRIVFAQRVRQPAFGRKDDHSIRVWKPYVIEKNCVESFDHCKVRMDYAPHQRAMVVRPGSYWYQKPFKVYRYGDFKHRHRHAAAHSSRHVAWCSHRYRTYDPATDTFVGKGYRHYRCNSPYDGR